MAAYSLGSLVVELGADVRGLLGINDAMLKVQREMLTSVNKIVAALDRIEKKSISVSNSTTNNVIQNEEKKRKEYTKTAQTQESLAKGKLAITEKDVSNVMSEKNAVSQLAEIHNVSEAVIREAIQQRIAVIKQDELKIAAMNKIHQKALEQNAKFNQQIVTNAKRAVDQEIKERLRVVQARGAEEQKKIQMAIATAEAENKARKVSLDDFTKNIATTAQRIRTFGYLASAVITLPIIQAGKAAFNMAKDFEYSMQKIVGLSNVAQESVNKWRDEVMKMGPELGKSPKELADALYFISSSGIKGKEALDVLRSSAKASAAGLGETKEVADLLTSALNAYAGTGLTAARAADILVAAIREGKGEASAFATTMGQIIPIAANLGVSFDQVAGGMAAITLTGSSASNAAVYLKGVFNSLLTASSQGEKALKAMGTSYAELRTILAGQGLIPLMQKLRDLQLKWGDEAISEVLPNIRALTGYMSIAGKNFMYNAQLIERVRDSTGSLNNAYKAVAETIQQRFNKAIAISQVAMVTLGKSVAATMLPVIEKLAERLNKVIIWFDSLSETQKRTRINIIAFVAALGPVSLILSAIMYGVTGLITVFKGLWTALKYTVQFLRSLTLAIMEMPWMWLAYAIGIAVIALVRFVREKNALNIAMDKAAELNKKEQVSLTILADRITKAAIGTKKRTDAIQTFNDNYGTYLRNLITEKSSVEDLQKAYNQAAEGVKLYTKAKVLQEELEKRSDKTSKVFRNQLKAFRNAILDYDPSALGDFYDRAYAVADKAIMYGGGKVDKVIKDQEIGKLYNEFISEIQKDAKKGSLTISEFAAAMDRFMEIRSREFGLNNAFKETNKQLETLKENAYKAQTAINDIALPNYAKRDQSKVAAIQEIWNKLKKAEESYNTLQKSYADIGNKSQTFAQERFNIAKEAFESMSMVITDKADPALIYITKLLKEAQDALTKTGKTQQFNEALDELWSNMLKRIDAAERMVEWNKKEGKSYDLVKDKAGIYLDTLKDLMVTQGITKGPMVDYINKKLKELNFNFSESAENARKYVKDLSDILGNLKIDLNANLLGGKFDPEFDKATADVEAYKKAYEDYKRKLMELEPLMPILGLGNVSFLVWNALIAKAKELKINLDDAITTQERMEDLKVLRVLQAEADAFDTLAARIEVVNFTIQAQEKDFRKAIQGGLDPASKKAQEYANRLTALRGELVNLQNAQNIQWLTDMNNAFQTGARNADLVTGYISALQNKLKYLSETNQGGGPDFQLLADNLKKLENTKDVMDILTSSFTDFFSITKEGFENFDDYIKKWLSSLLAAFQQFLGQKIAEKIVAALMPAEKTTGPAASALALVATNEAIVASEAARMAALAASIPVTKAAAIAAGQLAINLAAAAAAWIPFPGNVAAIGTSIAAVVTGITAATAGLAAATAVGLKEGGVVPQGYPNDTYPARLTSGETVLPAKKLDQYEFGKQSVAVIEGDVRFEIEDNKLVGILKKYERKNTRV